MKNINKSELEESLHDAIRSGNVIDRNTLRIILTEIKLAEIDKKGELNEQEMLALFQKQAKMRRESIAEAEKASRSDLIPVLQKELSFLKTYLPTNLRKRS